MYEQNPAPSLTELEEELRRLRHKRQYGKTLRGTVYVLITVAAIAVLAATLLLPVLRLSGSSMEPTFNNDDLVFAIKNTDLKRGDVVAFYYNNKVLVKRVMGLPGDIIDMKEDGTVLVNGEEFDEPYLLSKSKGETDLKYPYQVSEKRIFVMGDHRQSSRDSRLTEIGDIDNDLVVGKIVFRFWPLNKWGRIG